MYQKSYKADHGTYKDESADQYQDRTSFFKKADQWKDAGKRYQSQQSDKDQYKEDPEKGPDRSGQSFDEFRWKYKINK